MKAFIGLIVVILLAALVVGSAYIGLKNSIVEMEEDVDNKWAQIDNQLQRRNELLTKLLGSMKGFLAHEEKAVEMITSARAKLAGGNLSRSEQIQAEGQISSALSRLLVVSENNPELKADNQFRQFNDEIAGTENRLAVARKEYNQAVKRFNTKIKQWPGSTFGYEKKPYFEVSEEKKEDVKVEF